RNHTGPGDRECESTLAVRGVGDLEVSTVANARSRLAVSRGIHGRVCENLAGGSRRRRGSGVTVVVGQEAESAAGPAYGVAADRVVQGDSYGVKRRHGDRNRAGQVLNDTAELRGQIVGRTGV